MDEDKKPSGAINKLVMGIIIGGAIGSVVGLTLAPRKGKETREMIKKKGQDFIHDHRETIESAKYQMKKGGGGFLRWAIRLLLKKKTKNEPMPRVSLDEEKPPS